MAKKKKSVLPDLLMLGVLLVIFVLLLLYVTRDRGDSPIQRPVEPVIPTASPTPMLTPSPILTPTPTPIPTPTPTPTVNPHFQVIDVTPHPDSDPAINGIRLQSMVKVNGTKVNAFSRENEIHMGDSSAFSTLEGITTFRGNNYRDTAAYGVIPNNPTRFKHVWTRRIGGIDEWTGVGWTGQCSIVRWPQETIDVMNIHPDKKKEGLTEILYAALDGKVHFFDLEDGKDTRDPIKIGAPIKGSLSVDPRGYPLLYVGQGIDEVKGVSVKIGTRIFSLIDSSLLYFIDGRDPDALRRWYAFDCSPLIDGTTDTMIQLGENGIVYSVDLHSNYDPSAGTVSVDPIMTKYIYQQNLKGQLGSENSAAVYNNYLYFANNTGIIQCLDLNTMQIMWAFNAGDDTDATLVIEVEESGLVALYTGCELDNTANKGNCYMRKLNALTGEELWCVSSYCVTSSSDIDGGVYATPALGKGTLSDLIFFHVARTRDTGGMLYAINKHTGKIEWEKSLKKYGWSSPVCVYSEDGTGYVIVGSYSGHLRMFAGRTGELICEENVGANIECSPTVFGDRIIFGTRNGYIYCAKIE